MRSKSAAASTEEEEQQLILYSLPDSQSRDILRSIESFFSIHRILISSILLVVNAALGTWLTSIVAYIYPVNAWQTVVVSTAILAGTTVFGAFGIWVILRCSPPIYSIQQCQGCSQRGIFQMLPAQRRSMAAQQTGTVGAQ